MKREELESILKSQKPLLKEKYHVQKIGIFGSYARDEQNDDSDVDILVEFNKRVDLFHFVDLKEYLESVLNKKVDLVTHRALRKYIKEEVLNEVIYQ